MMRNIKLATIVVDQAKGNISMSIQTSSEVLGKSSAIDFTKVVSSCIYDLLRNKTRFLEPRHRPFLKPADYKFFNPGIKFEFPSGEPSGILLLTLAAYFMNVHLDKNFTVSERPSVGESNLIWHIGLVFPQVSSLSPTYEFLQKSSKMFWPKQISISKGYCHYTLSLSFFFGNRF